MTGGERLPLVPGDSDDPALAGVFGRFREAGHAVPTLYRALGNAPAMLDAWVGMAWPLRHDATTPRGLRELMILRVAQVTNTPYEWVAHRPAALKAGVTPDQVRHLRDWERSDQFSEVERLVLALTEAVIAREQLPDPQWSALETHFSPGDMIELVLTAAYYSCVSCTLTALRLQVAPDDPHLADF